jgi:hypothetical protein
MLWYEKEEEYLLHMQEICNILSQKYMNLYIVTHRKQTKLRLPAIILSSCSGVASFGSSGFSQSAMKSISIVVGIVNVGIAILQTYESYLKIADIVSKSLATSQALKKLSDDIQCETYIPIEDRSCNGVTFLRDCYSRYQAILDQAPPMEELTNAKLLRMRLSKEIEKHNMTQKVHRLTNPGLDPIYEHPPLTRNVSSVGTISIPISPTEDLQTTTVPILSAYIGNNATRPEQKTNDTL